MLLFPGSLITTPQPQEVTEGDPAWFNCSTDSAYGEINWKYSYVDSVRPRDVYTNGMLMNGYKESGRFSVDTSTIGNSVLLIRNVQTYDAGVFICVDNNGTTESSSAKLTVRGLNDNLTFHTIHRQLTVVKLHKPTEYNLLFGFSRRCPWKIWERLSLRKRLEKLPESLNKQRG